MNIKFDKELLKGIGNVSLKLGKAIVIEGTKAVVINAAVTTIKASFDGLDSVKDLTFDDLLSGKDKKKKSKKKGLFAKVKNEETGEDEEIEVEIIDAEETKVTE